MVALRAGCAQNSYFDGSTLFSRTYITLWIERGTPPFPIHHHDPLHPVQPLRSGKDHRDNPEEIPLQDDRRSVFLLEGLPVFFVYRIFPLEY